MKRPLLSAAALAVLLFGLALFLRAPNSSGDSSAVVESIDVSIPVALIQRVNASPNTNRARNVIVFIGDGMGLSTITAGRIFDGQERGVDGESNSLSFEHLPHTALIKTYNTNQQVPDSAGTATAIFTGTKTRAGVISVGPDAYRQDCESAKDHPLATVLDLAEQRGLKTGIVTTTRLTNATPAVLYAKSPERDWENDSLLTDAAKRLGCVDIAAQLVSYPYGDGPDVILGGGRAQFLPSSDGGQRQDGRHLLDEWRDKREDRYVVLSGAALQTAPTNGQLLGVFASSHMTYVLNKPEDSPEPSLTEMTTAALSRLENADVGYFLLVEGGRIDHGHHDGIAGAALLEVQAFSDAIAATLKRVDLNDTLVMVTADHSHVFTIAGYPTRGNPILGLVHGNDSSGRPASHSSKDINGIPYATLGYQNGPGADSGHARVQPGVGLHSKQQALIPTFSVDPSGEVVLSETHGGEDVALFAGGPWAHLARGVMEQNVIFDLIVFALGWTGDD